VVNKLQGHAAALVFTNSKYLIAMIDLNSHHKMNCVLRISLAANVEIEPQFFLLQKFHFLLQSKESFFCRFYCVLNTTSLERARLGIFGSGLRAGSGQ
jgi:hypothetical protein